MGSLKLFWRPVLDYAPYLYTLRHAAAKFDLDLQLELATGAEYGELVLAGKGDFLLENFWNLQLQRAKGSPFVSIAVVVTDLNEHLVVGSGTGIESVQDLRGKRLAVRGHRPSDLLSVLWLRDLGLEGQVEVSTATDGEIGRWGMWKKIIRGESDAALITNLYVDDALAAGLRAIPLEPYGYFGNGVFTTRRDLMEDRRPDMEKFVRAVFETARLFREDHDTVLGIMRGEPARLMKRPYVTIETPEKMERVYQVIRDYLAWPPIPSLHAVSLFHRMMFPTYPEMAGFNPLLMWDLSLANKVMQEGPR